MFGRRNFALVYYSLGFRNMMIFLICEYIVKYDEKNTWVDYNTLRKTKKFKFFDLLEFGGDLP